MQTYNQLIYIDDESKNYSDFEEFDVFHTFNDHVVAVHIHKDKIIVGTRDGKVYIGNKDTGNFVEKIQCSSGRYIVNGWGITSKDNNIFISEYGQSETEGARIFRSTDNGENFTVVKTLDPTNSNHFHAVKIDPYTDYVWTTWGDVSEAIEYSTDYGETWNIIESMAVNQSEEQSINIVPTENAVYFASDARTSGCLLGVYNKNTGEYSRLVEEVGKYMNIMLS